MSALCHDGTGNVVSWELMAPVVYQFVLKAGGTGQAVHVLAAKQTCSVVETGKRGSHRNWLKTPVMYQFMLKAGELQVLWKNEHTLVTSIRTKQTRNEVNKVVV